MSHELRTPLNAIIGYIELLQEEMEETGPPRHLEDLQRIRSSARHLLAMISEILDLSKIEAGKMQLQLEDFSIEPLVREVFLSSETLASKNGNRLELDLEPELRQAFGDSMRTRQILLNLLSNACKFTHAGVVRLGAIRNSVEGEGWLTFVVSDTGIGISADDARQLFGEFVQGSSSKTRKYGGTGLGLAISKRFAMMMGGDLTLQSELGRGSTFTVTLPASVEVPEQPAATEEPELAHL